MTRQNWLGMWLWPDDTFFGPDQFAGKTVLNYGCGNRKHPEHIGIDVSDNSDADHIITPPQPMPLADASVDVAFSRYVLEHVEDIRAALTDIARVLKPGAAYRYCVPHAFSTDAWDDPTHVRFYTLQSAKYFIGDSDVHYSGYGFSTCQQYLRLSLAWPRWKIIRWPANAILGGLGFLAPSFSEQLIKLPFINGSLYVELRKAS